MYCSHVPESFVATKSEPLVSIIIITWCYKLHPMNISILLLKSEYEVRIGSHTMRSSQGYVMRCLYTKGNSLEFTISILSLMGYQIALKLHYWLAKMIRYHAHEKTWRRALVAQLSPLLWKNESISSENAHNHVIMPHLTTKFFSSVIIC